MIEESNFQWMGSGAYRIAIAPSGEESLIIKIAHGHERARGMKMNKTESTRQQDFEGLFPKVYGAAEDFRWIVVDRVNPMQYKDGKLARFFPWLSIALKRSSGWGDNIYDIFRFLLKSMSSEDSFDIYNGKSVLESQFNISGDDYITLRERAISDPLFMRLIKASNTLNIDTDDLTEGNLGISSEGGLVILDSSVRDDFR
jgi:hypothetical protein